MRVPWLDQPEPQRPKGGSQEAGAVETHAAHPRVLPQWSPPNMELRGVKRNPTSRSTAGPGLMSIQGTEGQAWSSENPDLHGVQLVPKPPSSPAQIQEAPASGPQYPQGKHGVFGWTEVLWRFPDLCEHRLQY